MVVLVFTSFFNNLLFMNQLCYLARKWDKENYILNFEDQFLPLLMLYSSKLLLNQAKNY